MESTAILSILFTLTLLQFLHATPPTTAATVLYPEEAAAATTATTNNKTTEFIRTSCLNTQYPDLCYNSLSIYANAVRQDPARLARAAIGVSLVKAKYTSIYFHNLASQAEYRSDPRVKAALSDCLSVLSDAVDEIHESLTQIKKSVSNSSRGGGGLETFKFEMSNVQTWMSAALTNEETCTDGFDDFNDMISSNNNNIKYDVYDQIKRTEEVTSNALALVNSYVASVTVSVVRP